LAPAKLSERRLSYRHSSLLAARRVCRASGWPLAEFADVDDVDAGFACLSTKPATANEDGGVHRLQPFLWRGREMMP
jgi:hypothetical protein